MISMTPQEINSAIQSIIDAHFRSVVIKVTADSGTEGVTCPNGSDDRNLTVNIYGVKLANSGMGVTFDYAFNVIAFNPTEMDLSGIDISGFNSLSFPTMTTVKKLNLSGWDVSSISNIKSLISEISNSFENLEELNLSNWNTSNVTDMSSMFYRCNSLTSLNLSGWNTGSVTDMGGMFYHCNSLTSLNLSGWNTSNVTHMYYMFQDCSSITSLDLSNWNTSNLNYMAAMFEDCSSLTSLNLSGWDTSNVINMKYTFSGCSSLTSLNLSNNTLNTDFISDLISKTSTLTDASFDLRELILDGWDFSNFTDRCSTILSTLNSRYPNLETLSMKNASLREGETYLYDFSNTKLKYLYMNGMSGKLKSLSDSFKNCKTLLRLEFGDFDTTEVNSLDYMFCNCNSLICIDFGNTFDTSNVTTMNHTFEGCNKLEELKNFNFNTSNVTSISFMFNSCYHLTSLDLSGWDISKVYTLYAVFANCTRLSYLNISNWNTSNVGDLFRTFSECSKLTPQVSDWDTSNVASMKGTFEGCEAMESLDLSKWNTSKVNDMCRMFSGCFKLTSLDLSSFDTSNVTDMSVMFGYCNELTSLDLSSFDTSNVVNMRSMFLCCPSLTSLDLSSFNTSKATNMSSVFCDCPSLTSLDLSNFDTSKVRDMSYLFTRCESLTSLDLSNWNTSNVTDITQMFNGCTSLTSIDLSDWDVSKVTDMSYMFSGCSSLTSLDLSSFDTSKVTNINGMFSDSSVSSIDLSKLNTRKVTSYSRCFKNVTASVKVSDSWTLGYSKTLTDAIELTFLMNQKELTSTRLYINKLIDENKYGHIKVNYFMNIFTRRYIDVVPTSNPLYILSETTTGDKMCTVIKFTDGKVSTLLQRPVSEEYYEELSSNGIDSTNSNATILLNYRLNPSNYSGNVVISKPSANSQTIYVVPLELQLRKQFDFADEYTTGDTFKFNPSSIESFTPIDDTMIDLQLCNKNFEFELTGYNYKKIPDSVYSVMKDVQFSRMYKTSNKKLIIIASIVANDDYGKWQRLVSYSLNKAKSNGINLKPSILNTYFYCIINDKVRKGIYPVKDTTSQHYILQNSVTISTGDKIYIEIELELE